MPHRFCEVTRMSPEQGHGDYRAQEQRINAIVGGDDGWDIEAGMGAFLRHLQAELSLPFDVTGSEDFDWEEYYIIGPGRASEHRRLRQTQPSHQDTYELLQLVPDEWSEWMLFGPQDIGTRCRRKSDGKEFVLGLSELKATDPASPNAQLLDDYAVWFVNSR
jgi:hypothetical protein